MTSSGPTAVIRSVHHVSISIPDIETAIDWYGRVFGFAVDKRFAIDAIPAQGAFLERDGLRLELWQAGTGASVSPARREPNTDLFEGGTKHVAFAVDDLQGQLEALHEAGVDIAAIQRHPTMPMQVESMPPAQDPPAFAAFIRDPFGTLIELLEAEKVADDD
jgi:methylmalonyl-CoA/ethylmalonyl-CoA epimerase